MPEQKTQVSLLTVLGVLFTLIAVVTLVALLRLKSLADTAVQNVGVQTANPVVDTISALQDQDLQELSVIGLTPYGGLMRDVTVSGVVHDDNGCNDIDHVNIVMYRSGATNGASCTPDNNDCYVANQVPVTGCGDVGDLVTAANFSSVIAVPNFIDPTDGTGYKYDGQHWNIKVTVVDKGSLENLTDVPYTFAVNSLAAFNIDPGSINYGSVSLGAQSSEQTLTFANIGNRDINATVVADNDMTEPSGNFAVIPVGNSKYSLAQGFDYSTTGTAVVKAPAAAETFAIQLPQQTNDSLQPTVPTYWKLSMPTSGVSGEYHNTLTLTAARTLIQ